MAAQNGMNREFWKDRRVFVTGHTGFKGSWLCTWLVDAGARVTGYALAPDTRPSLFDSAGVEQGMTSILADVRDAAAIQSALTASGAEIVFHLAAQSLVRESYRAPVETYATNVMGTANVLEAVRNTPSVRAVVVVTSDKCYENREWSWPYRESDPLGGHDPYSSSKACAELVAAAYRASFHVPIATARAGNVIGGGDWAKDRLVPDLMRAFAKGEAAVIRNPLAIRPWQHVLEPLHGYLILAESLLRGEHADAWNFGPGDADVKPVQWVADELVRRWGNGASWTQDSGSHPHEAHMLKLDSAKARTQLHWMPRLSLSEALDWIVEWHREFDVSPRRASETTLQQIKQFEALSA